eukprot:700399-Prymnesium_polylepis.1
MARTAAPIVFEWCARQAPPWRPLNHEAADCCHKSSAPPTRDTESNVSRADITCAACLQYVYVWGS